MSTTSKELAVRSKVWFVDANGDVVFGLGRLRMLEAIKRTGSIHAAAKELKMSYRAVWGRIKATEERLGAELLIKSIGGASGGGSTLTPYAEQLIERFRKTQKDLNKKADAICRKHFKEVLNV